MTTPPEIIDGVYRVAGELGRGGMSIVYLAEHIFLGRRVALKVPLPELVAHEDTRGRYEREAQLMAQLHHQNIPAIYDMRWSDELCYIAMEYVEGMQLLEYIDSLPSSTLVHRVLSLLHPIANVLDFAHGEGVIHRDLKPTNILVERKKRRIKILDFGLARAHGKGSGEFRTSVGIVTGTPGYMAPEQMIKKESTPAGDIYSFGVLLYRLLSGRLPWERKGMQLAMEQLLKAPNPIHEANPRLPGDLHPLFVDCLSLDPEKRPGTAGGLLFIVLRMLGKGLLTMPYQEFLGIEHDETSAGDGAERSELVAVEATWHHTMDQILGE